LAAKYQDDKGQLACKTCRSGKVVNAQQTACETPEWAIPEDCVPKEEYLDDSDPDRLNHACQRCPPGGDCPDLARLGDVSNLAGFWRADPQNPDFDAFPFYPCPSEQACTAGGNTTSGQCLDGHDPSTPLCASCLPGYYLAGMKPTQRCEVCPERLGDDTVTPELVVFISGAFSLWMIFVCVFVSQPVLSEKQNMLIQTRLETLSLQLQLKDESHAAAAAAGPNTSDANLGDGSAGDSDPGDAEWQAVKKESFQRAFQNTPLTPSERSFVFDQIDTTRRGSVTRSDMENYIRSRLKAKLLKASKRAKKKARKRSSKKKKRDTTAGDDAGDEVRAPSSAGAAKSKKADDDDDDDDINDVGHAEVLSETLSSQREQKTSGGSLSAVSRGGVLMKAKLVIGFSQCIAFIPITFAGIPWPKALIWVADLLYMMSVDFLSMFGNICKLHTSFYTRFVFQIIFLPIMFVTTWAAHHVTVRACRRGPSSCCKRRAASFTRESAWTRFCEILFLTAYALYTTISTTIFRVLKCAKIQDRWHLEVQYSELCWEGKWYLYAVIACVGIAVYTAGIPGTLYYVLRKNKRYLYEESCPADQMHKHALVSRRLGAVYASYNADSYFYDLLDMARRLVLTAGLVVLGEDSNSQILLGALICTVWLCLILVKRPFRAFWDNALSTLLSFQHLVVILTGMSLKINQLADKSNKGTEHEQQLEDGAVAALLALSTISVIVLGMLSVLLAVPCVQKKIALGGFCCARCHQRFVTRGVSPTTPSTSVVPVIVVDDGTDLSEARNRLQGRISQHALAAAAPQPANATPAHGLTRSADVQFDAEQDETVSITNRVQAEARRASLAHVTETLRRQSTAVSRLRHRIAARSAAKRSRCLQASPVFSSLTDASIGAIVDAMEFEIVEAGGAALCVEGGEADRMFLLMAGSCDVFVGQAKVGRLNRLDVFGEAALFRDENGSFTRTATVRVAKGEPANLLVLQKSALDRLVSSGVIGDSCVQHLRRVAQLRRDNRLEHARGKAMAV
jgi:hypothetical protein